MECVHREFYALAIVEMQNCLRITASEVKQVWLADDATGAGSIESLKKWRINIDYFGRYGYYVNESKSWLFLKNQTLLKKKTESLFSDIKITLQQKERGT